MPKRQVRPIYFRQKKAKNINNETHGIHGIASCLSSALHSATGAEASKAHRFILKDEYASRFSAEDVQVPNGDWVHLACPEALNKCFHCNDYDAHGHWILIGIHGTSSNKGHPNGISSVGIYFGKDNDYNQAYTLDFRTKHTTQLAELEACIKALKQVFKITNDARLKKKEIDRVVIKSDSEYIALGVTEWMAKWKINGWMTCAGADVANRTHFLRIERLVKKLKEEEGISVQFWHVPKASNKEADGLAKFALDYQIKGSISLRFPFL
ncbi:ribonuclease H-like domain-containing protein [Aspergillus californicus]